MIVQAGNFVGGDHIEDVFAVFEAVFGVPNEEGLRAVAAGVVEVQGRGWQVKVIARRVYRGAAKRGGTGLVDEGWSE